MLLKHNLRFPSGSAAWWVLILVNDSIKDGETNMMEGGIQHVTLNIIMHTSY